MNSKQLTLYAEEIPANQAQKRAWEKARQMTATSGRRNFDLYDKNNPLSSLTKTLMERFPTASLTGRLMTWKVKATPAKRTYYQLRPLERSIGGTEFGLSLITPTALDIPKSPDQYRKQKAGKKNWKRNGTKFTSLGSQLIFGLLIPTPTLNDSKNSTMPPSQAYCRKGYQGTLVSALLHMGISPGTFLNPVLWECLMGYPKEWTTPIETDE